MGLRLDDDDLEALIGYARFLGARRKIQTEHLKQLAKGAEAPIVELPFLFSAGLALPDIETLADVIEEQSAEAVNPMSELAGAARRSSCARARVVSERRRPRPRSGSQAALEGKKAAVLTIDPAKRLASSLGLKELSNEPDEGQRAKFSAAGLEADG